MRSKHLSIVLICAFLFTNVNSGIAQPNPSDADQQPNQDNEEMLLPDAGTGDRHTSQQGGEDGNNSQNANFQKQKPEMANSAKINDDGRILPKKQGENPQKKTVVPIISEDTSTLRSRTMNLAQLGIDYELTLRGVQASVGIPFGVRTDELVQTASLNLKYSYSPSLIPDLSHIRVSVNGVTVATIPLTHEGAGEPKTSVIAIDPRLITAYNRINLELDAHYSRDCENPEHSSLWANVDGASTLTVNSHPVVLANELSLLPVPFFDVRDTRRLDLSFYFPDTPNMQILQSAGIVSSYFGSVAGYRGATFSGHKGSDYSPGNGVIVATLDNIPAKIVQQLPEIRNIKGPGLAIVTNPNDRYGKILVVTGHDESEVKTAASALALHSPLSGAVTSIEAFSEVQPRVPYDAPNWVSSTRPVRFGELADQAGQAGKLSVTGYQPEVIRVGMHLPPDLFVWERDGIPVSLKYRYTMPDKETGSTLNVNINQTFVTALPLDGHPYAEWPPIRWWNSLSTTQGKMPIVQPLILPTHTMSANSQLRFQFRYDRHLSKSCAGSFPDVSAAIDPDSTIDLSSFNHYMAMPNLAAFGNAGFPFTRLADLADTVVVLPSQSTEDDYTNVLTLMGRFGALTGYPTLRNSLITADEITKYNDANFIVLGSKETQPLYESWKTSIPVTEDAIPHSDKFSLTDWLLKKLPPTDRLSANWNGEPQIKNTNQGFFEHVYYSLLHRLARYVMLNDVERINAKVSLQSQPGDVLLMGFESPIHKDRSVVAIRSDEPGNLDSLFDVWFDAQQISKIQGSSVLLRQGEVKSLANSRTYYVGELPMLTWWRWFLPTHPVWLALGVLIACIIVGLMVRTLMRIQSSSRLRQGGD